MKYMEEFKRLHHQLNLSSQLPEVDTHFLPSTTHGRGHHQRSCQREPGHCGGGGKVSVVTEPVGVEPEPHHEEANVNYESAMVEECDVGSVNERSLVEEENVSILEAVNVGAQGGSDDSGDEQVCVRT